MTETSEHENHGRGDDIDGPDGEDCPCRLGQKELECAVTGCGFCAASVACKRKKAHNWEREIYAAASPHELLHRLWSKAVGTPLYVKAEWRRLEALLFPASTADKEGT